ncbi:MAG: polynucleotide adenylyltransferase PcnB [Desulfarculaceae bacterium]
MDTALISENNPRQLPQARVIPRPRHGISRKNIDPDALKVLYRLHRHGFIAYLVGGSVRDLLLGRRPKDFDISTDAHPQQIHKLFRNSRIIGRRFRLVQVFFRGGKIIEVSTFRRAADPDPSGEQVLQANNTFGNAAEDALRRDLTINALFYNIADFSVVDYIGGLTDLKAGLIRAVGDADLRFRRDPVRVLRAVRHAARTGFSLTGDTLAAIMAHKKDLALCPTSRIRDELMRDLAGGSSAAWLELAHRTGVLYSLLPTLESLYGADGGELLAQAQSLMAKVDASIRRGKALEDSVVVTALFWPALKSLAKGQEFPPGRPGRNQWTQFVRETLPSLAAPVAFAKRVVERMQQIGGVMFYLESGEERQRLPKKVSEKGYFEAACQLGDLLGEDLRALARPSRRSGRRRRRRRPRRKKPAPKTQA